MSLTSLGSISLAVALPGAAQANAALLIACDVAAPNVGSQITAMASFSPSVSVDLSSQLALAESIIANIEAAIAAIPPIPTVSLSAQVALALALKADLEAMLALINAKLSLQASLASLLATAGVTGYAWDGANNALGPALTTALGGAGTHTNAVILLTTSGGTWTAMQAVLKTS